VAILCFLYHGDIIEGVFVEKYEQFLWGTATAAYQIEGAANIDGREPSIWDLYSKIPGKIANNDNGDIADDSYNQYEKDVQLLKQLGVNAYRFSVAWTRIIPKGYGEINQAGIDHYNKVINLLLENSIEPVVTLFHWDLPQGLEDRYSGLLSPLFETDFANFADVCFKAFGDRVKKWITLNEPWTVAVQAYGVGIFAPGRCSDRSRCAEGDSTTESYLAAHNMLNAHAAVVGLYREKYAWNQHGIIGITLNHDWAMPYTNSTANIAAAHRRSIFQLAWFSDPIYFGDYPREMKELVGDRLPVFSEEQKCRIKGSLDFLGMNHYTSKYFLDRTTTRLETLPKIVQDAIEIPAITDGWKYDQMNYESRYDSQGELIGPQAESVWLQAVPKGFYEMIMWIHRRYEHSLSPNYVVPLYITENGCSAPHEYALPLPLVLNDTYR
jgi:beta-glucosidase